MRPNSAAASSVYCALQLRDRARRGDPPESPGRFQCPVSSAGSSFISRFHLSPYRFEIVPPVFLAVTDDFRPLLGGILRPFDASDARNPSRNGLRIVAPFFFGQADSLSACHDWLHEQFAA